MNACFIVHVGEGSADALVRSRYGTCWWYSVITALSHVEIGHVVLIGWCPTTKRRCSAGDHDPQRDAGTQRLHPSQQ